MPGVERRWRDLRPRPRPDEGRCPRDLSSSRPKSSTPNVRGPWEECVRRYSRPPSIEPATRRLRVGSRGPSSSTPRAGSASSKRAFAATSSTRGAVAKRNGRVRKLMEEEARAVRALDSSVIAFGGGGGATPRACAAVPRAGAPRSRARRSLRKHRGDQRRAPRDRRRRPPREAREGAASMVGKKRVA